MSTSPLLIAPDFQKEEYMHVDPASARWEHLNFAARMLHQGETWNLRQGRMSLHWWFWAEYARSNPTGAVGWKLASAPPFSMACPITRL